MEQTNLTVKLPNSTIRVVVDATVEDVFAQWAGNSGIVDGSNFETLPRDSPFPDITNNGVSVEFDEYGECKIYAEYRAPVFCGG